MTRIPPLTYWVIDMGDTQVLMEEKLAMEARVNVVDNHLEYFELPDIYGDPVFFVASHIKCIYKSSPEIIALVREHNYKKEEAIKALWKEPKKWDAEDGG